MGGYTSRLGFTVGGFSTLRLSEALSIYKVDIQEKIERKPAKQISPAARKMASEAKVDLSEVKGSGKIDLKLYFELTSINFFLIP